MRAARPSAVLFSACERIRVRARRSPLSTDWMSVIETGQVAPSVRAESEGSRSGVGEGTVAGCPSTLVGLSHRIANITDDVLGGSTRAVDTADAQFLESWDVLIWNDASNKDMDILLTVEA